MMINDNTFQKIINKSIAVLSNAYYNIKNKKIGTLLTLLIQSNADKTIVPIEINEISLNVMITCIERGRLAENVPFAI